MQRNLRLTTRWTREVDGDQNGLGFDRLTGDPRSTTAATQGLGCDQKELGFGHLAQQPYFCGHQSQVTRCMWSPVSGNASGEDNR